MTQVRWPLLLDEHEASFEKDEPFDADPLAVSATLYVAGTPLRFFIEIVLEFFAGLTLAGLIITVALYAIR